MPGWSGCDVCGPQLERFTDALERALLQALGGQRGDRRLEGLRILWKDGADPGAFLIELEPQVEAVPAEVVASDPAVRAAARALARAAAEAPQAATASWVPSPVLGAALIRLARLLEQASMPLATGFTVTLLLPAEGASLELRRRT